MVGQREVVPTKNVLKKIVGYFAKLTKLMPKLTKTNAKLTNCIDFEYPTSIGGDNFTGVKEDVNRKLIPQNGC